MIDEQAKQQIAGSVRTSQIIVAALSMGVVTYAVAVVFLISGDPPLKGNLLTLLAIVFAGIVYVLGLVIPHFVAAAQRQKIAAGDRTCSPDQRPVPDSDAGQLALSYLTKTLVGAALFEGGCFFALTAYLLEARVLSLGVAAVLLLCLLAQFPTQARVEAWIAEQRRRVEDERLFSR
ncbi:MAG: hypothetical protein GX575_03785 [Candidatus Anammoximicrobium sp.]|nr:hypothetical protein [Candidatus Anammoximicrobium sp.]